jgi:hypothetical protein
VPLFDDDLHGVVWFEIETRLFVFVYATRPRHFSDRGGAFAPAASGLPLASNVVERREDTRGEVVGDEEMCSCLEKEVGMLSA